MHEVDDYFPSNLLLQISFLYHPWAIASNDTVSLMSKFVFCAVTSQLFDCCKLKWVIIIKCSTTMQSRSRSTIRVWIFSDVNQSVWIKSHCKTWETAWKKAIHCFRAHVPHGVMVSYHPFTTMCEHISLHMRACRSFIVFRVHHLSCFVSALFVQCRFSFPIQKRKNPTRTIAYRHIHTHTNNGIFDFK